MVQPCPTSQLDLTGTRKARSSVEAASFNSKEAAEEHGLELCKDWIDKRP